jgi:hypothetical protein
MYLPCHDIIHGNPENLIVKERVSWEENYPVAEQMRLY